MQNIETLNKLLKNELSAMETYQQTMDKFIKDAELGKSENLKPIYDGHKNAVSSLQEQLRQLGAIPVEGSGVWGTWAEIVQGGANMLGNEAALKTLQAGEKSGEEDYKEALQETELLSEIRALIETKLLPAQQIHIRTLDRLLATEAD